MPTLKMACQSDKCRECVTEEFEVELIANNNLNPNPNPDPDPRP